MEKPNIIKAPQPNALEPGSEFIGVENYDGSQLLVYLSPSGEKITRKAGFIVYSYIIYPNYVFLFPSYIPKTGAAGSRIWNDPGDNFDFWFDYLKRKLSVVRFNFEFLIFTKNEPLYSCVSDQSLEIKNFKHQQIIKFNLPKKKYYFRSYPDTTISDIDIIHFSENKDLSYCVHNFRLYRYNSLKVIQQLEGFVNDLEELTDYQEFEPLPKFVLRNFLLEHAKTEAFLCDQ